MSEQDPTATAGEVGDAPAKENAGAPPTKAQRRAAAKARAVRAAALRRRRIQAVVGALGALAVVGIVLAVTYVVRGDDTQRGGSGRPTASGPATSDPGEPEPVEPTPTEPALPPNADPALGTKPAVRAGGGGRLTALRASPVIEGTGAPLRAGQQVTVNYVGVFYATGEEFGSSWDGSGPFRFELGSGNVIKGWDQGLVGVTVGSRVQLDVPATLAYGANPTEGRPPGDLRFVVDVLSAQ